MFQKLHIRDTDQFVSSHFPQLDESLQQVVVQLSNEPSGAKTEMVLSFIKNHSINSQQVIDYPEFANLISSNSLPLQVMEALFESSRQNPLFRKQLEEYVITYLSDHKV